MESSRRFKRKVDNRSYKKLFLIASEGIKTEPQYFEIVQRYCKDIVIRCIKKKVSKNSPKDVLAHLKKTLKSEYHFTNQDEAWVVIDRDEWQESELEKILDWSHEKDNYHFALSNPAFEYWLLLHFENGVGIGTLTECLSKLKKHLPHYEKGVSFHNFSLEQIKCAIENAKNRNVFESGEWPKGFGTTVYKLVEAITDLE